MLDADWYAVDRATEPNRIELHSDENRVVTIGLSQAIAVGETIRPNTITSKIVEWRVPSRAYPMALDNDISYDPAAKAVARKIDASVLPRNTPLVYQVSFDVETLAAGVIDRRSVFIVILVRV